MQNRRHHQILGPSGALAEILRNDGEPVFLELLPGKLERTLSQKPRMAMRFFELGDRQ